MIPEAYANIGLALGAYKQIADSFKPKIEVFANFPSNYLGLINEDESIEFTDGALRLIDPAATSSKTASPPPALLKSSARPSSPTATPSCLLQAARLSQWQLSRRSAGAAQCRSSMGTPQADKELAEFKQLASAPCKLLPLSPRPAHRHPLRYRENRAVLTDPLILDKHVRAIAGVNRLEGAGQAEAPRGTLHHHYKVDENGLITWANLVIATGQNNKAMNLGVLQASKALHQGRQVH